MVIDCWLVKPTLLSLQLPQVLQWLLQYYLNHFRSHGWQCIFAHRCQRTTASAPTAPGIAITDGAATASELLASIGASCAGEGACGTGGSFVAYSGADSSAANPTSSLIVFISLGCCV